MRVIPFIAVTGVCALVFVLVPEIDLWVAKAFYSRPEGFFLRDWPPVVFLYDIIDPITAAVMAIAAGMVVLRAVPWVFARWPVPHWPVPRWSLIAYIVLSFGLGPGLLTNEVLKNYVDRARPTQISEFGGTASFTPALVPADQCETNCSFVSGHASMAFAMITFVFLLPAGRWRRAGIGAAVAFGAVMGLARMAQGAHFLSDVIFAGLFNIGLIWALHEWIVRRNELCHPAIAGPARRLGDRLSAIAVRTGQRATGTVMDGWRRLAQDTRRRYAATLAVGLLATVSYLHVDRPAVEWFRGFGPDLHAFFKGIASLGHTTGWLVSFLAAFLVLRGVSRHPRLEAWRGRLRAWSMLPLFLLTSLLASGVVMNVLKIAFGRARPKLYLNEGTYGFDWWRLHPDFLSFPSGHAASITAIMAALYFIWPRHLLAYALIGGVIAFSRAAETAHFLSDVLVGACLAMLVTAWVRRVFQRSGIDLHEAASGEWTPPAPSDRAGRMGQTPWPERLGLPAAIAKRISGRKARPAAAPDLPQDH